MREQSHSPERGSKLWYGSSDHILWGGGDRHSCWIPPDCNLSNTVGPIPGLDGDQRLQFCGCRTLLGLGIRNCRDCLSPSLLFVSPPFELPSQFPEYSSLHKCLVLKGGVKLMADACWCILSHTGVKRGR